MRRFFAAFAICLLPHLCGALDFYSLRPSYYCTGVPLNGPVNKSTADMKFQFCLGADICKGMGGRDGLDLSFAYSQLSVWHFYDESSPFKDNMYIPGIYLTVPLKRDNLLFGLEHRSNGRPYRGSAGDTFSRSVNYLFAQYTAVFGCGLRLSANLRGGIGWYDEEFTQEVFYRYMGYATFTAGYQRGAWQLQLEATPVVAPFGVNITAEAARRVGSVSLFAQFHYGYDECLCDWVRGSFPVPYLRLGILLGELFR